MIWVLAQNGKLLMYCSRFEVTKVIGGRNKAGIIAMNNLGTSITVGVYENEDKALDELDKIMAFIIGEEKGIYKMN